MRKFATRILQELGFASRFLMLTSLLKFLRLRLYVRSGHCDVALTKMVQIPL